MDARERLQAALAGKRGAETVTDRVAEVLDVIVEARSRRVPWSEVAAQVARAGIRRDDGKPLSVPHLAKIVSRLTGAEVEGPQPAPKVVPQHAAPKAPRTALATATERPAAPGARATRAGSPMDDMGEGSPIPDLDAILAEDRPPPSRPVRDIDELLGKS